MIRVKIPYGDGSEEAHLTNSNQVKESLPDGWNKYPVEEQEAYIYIDLISPYDAFSRGIEEVFNFYDITFLPNPEEQSARTISIEVECYDEEEEGNLLQTKSLLFTLNNQSEEDIKKIPFVNYFALEALVEQNRYVIITWNISYGIVMMIYPRFLTDSNQPAFVIENEQADGEGQTDNMIESRSAITLSDQDPEPI